MNHIVDKTDSCTIRHLNFLNYIAGISKSKRRYCQFKNPVLAEIRKAVLSRPSMNVHVAQQISYTPGIPATWAAKTFCSVGLRKSKQELTEGYADIYSILN